MMKAAFGLSFVLAASSLSAHGSYARWSGPLPEIVEQNLPVNIRARDVLVHDGCFFYVYDGKVYQLLNASDGAKGLPVCIG